jgi:hypothetical protein
VSSRQSERLRCGGSGSIGTIAERRTCRLRRQLLGLSCKRLSIPARSGFSRTCVERASATLPVRCALRGVTAASYRRILWSEAYDHPKCGSDHSPSERPPGHENWQRAQYRSRAPIRVPQVVGLWCREPARECDPGSQRQHRLLLPTGEARKPESRENGLPYSDRACTGRGSHAGCPRIMLRLGAPYHARWYSRRSRLELEGGSRNNGLPKPERATGQEHAAKASDEPRRGSSRLASSAH